MKVVWPQSHECSFCLRAMMCCVGLYVKDDAQTDVYMYKMYKRNCKLLWLNLLCTLLQQEIPWKKKKKHFKR